MPRKNKLSWRPPTEEPERDKPILMKVTTGYCKPHHIGFMSGKFDKEYRPLSPWLSFSNNSMEDYIGSDNILSWCYLEEILG